jgi:hypothetical protein
VKLDISTTLTAYLDRVVDDIVDGIAKDGLVLLKRVLDEAGFAKSPYLKDYEVYAHVLSGNVISFEILLDVEAVVPQDDVTRQAIVDSVDQAAQVEAAAQASYGIGPSGPQRLVGKTNALRDARTPAYDRRRPARDVRQTSLDRLVNKEIANVTPRSARVDREGRLSVALKRAVAKSGETTVMPQGEFQGIIGKFLGELTAVISNQFSPGLSDIVSRYG